MGKKKKLQSSNQLVLDKVAKIIKRQLEKDPLLVLGTLNEINCKLNFIINILKKTEVKNK